MALNAFSHASRAFFPHDHGRELLSVRRLNWFHEQLPHVHVELPRFRGLVVIRFTNFGEGGPHVLQQSLVACKQLDTLLSDERLLPPTDTERVLLIV
jgi:hypothetical protein